MASILSRPQCVNHDSQLVVPNDRWSSDIGESVHATDSYVWDYLIIHVVPKFCADLFNIY